MLGTEAPLHWCTNLLVVSIKFPHLMQISSFTSVRIIGYTLISELFINFLFSIRDLHIFCWTGRYLIRLGIYGITVHVIASGFYCKMEHFFHTRLFIALLLISISFSSFNRKDKKPWPLCLQHLGKQPFQNFWWRHLPIPWHLRV